MAYSVVTGAAGFLGVNLCIRLLQEGRSIIAIDNFYSSNPKNSEPLHSHENYHFMEEDVRNPIELPTDDIDQIYHLACPASPPFYQKDPIFTAETCFLGTLHMLRLAQKTGARMLEASTSEVYGDPLEHPQKESYRGHVNPCGIRACYDEGKRISESLCFDYKRNYNTDVRVARIFNSYGPYMDKNDGRVVSNFIMQSLAGKALTIYGDGSQTRSFCHADDMIEALVRLMNYASPVDAPVNVGNPDEFSILALAELVLEMSKSNQGLSHHPLPEDDPMQRCPDITRAQSLLGWQPRIALREGLDKTMLYFKTQI